MSRIQHYLVAGAVLASVIVPARPAAAQAVGLRAGASGSPDQFYVGAHADVGPVVEALHFRPNLEIGVGNDRTLVGANFEFVYPMRLGQGAWSFYPGAGPALVVASRDGESNTGGGFNIVLGVEHDDGLFFELKVGAMDSPDVKVGVGYTFGR